MGLIAPPDLSPKNDKNKHGRIASEKMRELRSHYTKRYPILTCPWRWISKKRGGTKLRLRHWKHSIKQQLHDQVISVQIRTQSLG